MLNRKRPGLASSLSCLAALCLAAAAALDAAPPLDGFKYNKEIILNTSATGANVAGNVANFPVALNLSDANFDFAQAKADGSDLRFTKPDGSMLAYEIESWDAAGKAAAVWVKADVTGNSPSQAIVMHWGNPAATGTGDSKAVFPASDFLGAWHLGEAGNTTAGGYKDATPNQAHGTGANYTAASSVPGRIGMATRNSNALKNSITIDPAKKELFNPEKSWTLFLWTNIVSFPSNGAYHTMLSKGDGQFSMQRLGGGKTFEPCCWTGSYHMCAVGKMQGATNTWYRFAATFERGAGIKFYINNVPDANAVDQSAMEKSQNPMVIGNQTQGDVNRWWDGIMDEVRVTNGARSADWIKLDYESQKADSKFLTYGNVSTSFAKRSIPGWISPNGGAARVATHDLSGRRLHAGKRTGAAAVPGGLPFAGLAKGIYLVDAR
jgi:hypothetical protein